MTDPSTLSWLPDPNAIPFTYGVPEQLIDIDLKVDAMAQKMGAIAPSTSNPLVQAAPKKSNWIFWAIIIVIAFLILK
jgi:uncharacterized Rmd1/YagE family protein